MIDNNIIPLSCKFFVYLDNNINRKSIKMNYKVILFLTLILFISCDSKTVEVEVNSKGGMAYQGDSKGKKFSFGSDEDAKIAVDLILAFAKKDTETMASSMADSVRYMPPQGSKPIMASSEQIDEIVKLLHEPYDSLKRLIWNAVPLIKEGDDFTKVIVTFNEKRYYKDGKEESIGLIDRIYIKDGKIFNINQWMSER